MQIIPFLPHYQLVCNNFDFSSFSLISCCCNTAHKFTHKNYNWLHFLWETSQLNKDNLPPKVESELFKGEIMSFKLKKTKARVGFSLL